MAAILTQAMEKGPHCREDSPRSAQYRSHFFCCKKQMSGYFLLPACSISCLCPENLMPGGPALAADHSLPFPSLASSGQDWGHDALTHSRPVLIPGCQHHVSGCSFALGFMARGDGMGWVLGCLCLACSPLPKRPVPLPEMAAGDSRNSLYQMETHCP